MSSKIAPHLEGKLLQQQGVVVNMHHVNKNPGIIVPLYFVNKELGKTKIEKVFKPVSNQFDPESKFGGFY